MTEPEIRLRCVELALVQARAEQRPTDLERVAEIQTWFYDRVIVSDPPFVPPAQTEVTTGKADKSPDIFKKSK